MFARVTTAQSSPDRLDEGVAHFRDQILPNIQEMNGFRGNYTLIDRASGKTINISLWETEDAMQASAAAVTPMRAQALQGMGGSGESTVETFEVAIEPPEQEGQRLASTATRGLRELEGYVRRMAASDEVTSLRRQLDASLKALEDWGRRRNP